MSDHKSNTDVKMGSEKSFGLVFTAVFLLIALWPMKDGGEFRTWALVTSCAFAVISLIAPKLLAPLNTVWFKFGLLLHKIVSPIVMGILYFLTVTPIGLLMRLFGKDPLNQKLDREAQSYWVEIDPAKAAQSSMRHQF